ncbi:MAG TPA: mechanosensitive ion channel domain-containing protein, partial [Steroidobacteraceae bacterium]|nr:mechanosensitive ion channel domain-containing protein [Steroidobacteraceae bacterium]
MNSADSAASALLLRLTSPQVLGAVVALLIAAVIALLVARALRVRRARGATAAAQHPAHWLDHTLAGALLLAPLVAALAILLAGHAALAAFATPTAVIDGAVKIVGALALLRFGVYLLGLMLGPGSWVGTREERITLVLWVIASVALLGWLDELEAALNRVSLLPGRTQLSLWGLLKGLVIVTAFLVVTSLIARAIERHVMRLDQLAVSTRVGVSKFAYFLLLGLGMLLGINAAGVDVTTLNVLTGAIGLGLGFGLQSVASNFVSGFVLLMDKSIKPGDVISFTGLTGASAGNFGWVQELRGRYVVVRDRDGVDTLVPNQNLITSPFINWSYSDQRVRLKLPVTVSYDDDPEVALQLLLQAAENHPRILRDPPAVSRLISFEAYGMLLEVRFWIADNNVRSDVNRAIWRIFRAHGVTIPVPQQEMRILARRPPRALPDTLAQGPSGLDQAA